MEGLILGDIVSKDIGPLLVEQRRIADEFRVVEKSIQELHVRLAAKDIDPADRTAIELAIISRTEELMRVGRRMLELDASVAAAKSRPN